MKWLGFVGEEAGQECPAYRASFRRLKWFGLVGAMLGVTLGEGCFFSGGRLKGSPPKKYRVLIPVARQKGQASWYGPAFHGNVTANGEVFNKKLFTAAHRTLPFGTLVRVSSPKKGRSVIVRINDRGPNCPGRVIDLSEVAAKQIGLKKSGVEEVVLEVLEPVVVMR